jgi:hypothetical protein
VSPGVCHLDATVTRPGEDSQSESGPRTRVPAQRVDSQDHVARYDKFAQEHKLTAATT